MRGRLVARTWECDRKVAAQRILKQLSNYLDYSAISMVELVSVVMVRRKRRRWWTVEKESSWWKIGEDKPGAKEESRDRL